MKKTKTNNYKTKSYVLASQLGINVEDVMAVLKASELYDIGSFARGEGIKWGKSYTVYPKYVEPRNYFNPITKKEDRSKGHYILAVSPHNRAKESLSILAKAQLTKH